jgi:hypothetical protein
LNVFGNGPECGVLGLVDDVHPETMIMNIKKINKQLQI